MLICAILLSMIFILMGHVMNYSWISSLVIGWIVTILIGYAYFQYIMMQLNEAWYK